MDDGADMKREQTILRLPETEIPIRIFDEPGFWILVALVFAFGVLWSSKRKS